MSESVQNRIKDKLRKMSKGSIVFISDFSDIGTDTAVRQAMQRLSKKEFIIRLSQGIYYYPKVDKLLGMIKPSADQIAEAIKNRDQARIIPTGSYAQYRLGLTTQIPMNIVYLTDGSPRKVQVGNQKITFKKTNPKSLSVEHALTSLIIQALREIGKENIEQNHLNQIKDIIEKSNESKKIRENIKYAPVWIQKHILNVLNSYDNE
ncbi:MAG TPA: hypothetical protein ENI20_19195 [Bacteroides sp.]|nr:hypothetical protein [Bacteroides sp.]